MVKCCTVLFIHPCKYNKIILLWKITQTEFKLQLSSSFNRIFDIRTVPQLIITVGTNHNVNNLVQARNIIKNSAICFCKFVVINTHTHISLSYPLLPVKYSANSCSIFSPFSNICWACSRLTDIRVLADLQHTNNTD